MSFSFTFDRWLLKHVSSSHWGPVIEERRENLILHDLNMTCFISTLIVDVQDNVKFSILWILFLLARDLLMERFQLFDEHSKPSLFFSHPRRLSVVCPAPTWTSCLDFREASRPAFDRFRRTSRRQVTSGNKAMALTDIFYGWSSKFALESENTAVYYNLNNPPKDERPSSKHRTHATAEDGRVRTNTSLKF